MKMIELKFIPNILIDRILIGLALKNVTSHNLS